MTHSKKAAQVFQERVHHHPTFRWSEGLGTVTHPFILESPWGKVFASVPTPVSGSVFTVFLKLEAPDKDSPFDPHNGKWNVHEWTADEAITELDKRLQRIAIK